MSARTNDALRAAFDEPADVARLRERLTGSAERAGLLELAYCTVESPFGPLLLAATTAGLVRVAFELEDHDAVLAELARKISPRILRAPERLEPAARELGEYFAGRRRAFSVPLDLGRVPSFRRSVLLHLREIPYGATESYGEVAAQVGKPSAVRAAAGACSHNPLPLVVPCHRVVQKDGALGDYLGGRAVKRRLLEFESAA